MSVYEDDDSGPAAVVVVEAAPDEETPTAAAYEMCALCNNIIENEASHMQREHPHMQHIHTMLARPSPPLPSQGERDAAAAMVGAFAVATSATADRGEAAFRVVQRARAQLHRLLEGVQGSTGTLYLFGSTVSMGSWDGSGDADFTFVCPTWLYEPAQDGQVVVTDPDIRSDGEDGQGIDDAAAEELEPPAVDAADVVERHVDPTAPVMDTAPQKSRKLALSLSREKTLVRGITTRLRDAGFRFDELDPVLHTRIPVVRRKRTEPELPCLDGASSASLIRVRFDSADTEAQFRRGRLSTLADTYHATEQKSSGGAYIRALVLSVPDSTDAIHLMSRRERNRGVRKEWLGSHRRPEIFALDFDLSCRYHGIRNSWLLRSYLAKSDVFRVGNVFLKTWSKACGVNNSRVGFLTSYAISVLWIYYLLRHDEVAFVDPADIPELPDPAVQTEVPYIPLWPPAADADADAARTARLGRLLCGFFHFYGEEFDWATHVVTIREPCASGAAPRTKADLGWETSDTLSLVLRNRCYHIFSIEDVYEDNLDLGRHLTPEKAGWTHLQLRIASQRCRAAAHRGASAPLMWRLLDNPLKRAEAVLRARLHAYLLRSTEDATASVEAIVEYLSMEVTGHAADVDPVDELAYLACAYELSNRLCDLWIDEAQIKEDIELHKKHGRRNTDYTPPVHTIAPGEWAVVCSDKLPDNSEDKSYLQRRVRLSPHLSGGAGAVPPATEASARDAGLVSLRSQDDSFTKQLSTTTTSSSAKKEKQQLSTAAVGLQLHKSIASAAYSCHYPLQRQRLFATYEARMTFLRCAEDTVRELGRLQELARLQVEARGLLQDRKALLRHLVAKLCSHPACADPSYEMVLSLLCSPQELFIQTPPVNTRPNQPPMLRPTAQLHDLVSGERSGAAAAVVAKPSTKPAPRHAPGKQQQQQQQPTTVPSSVDFHRDMDRRRVQKGTCGECGRRNMDTYPSLRAEVDKGFYCVQCWASYT
ncbi:Cid1 family poly A polymerase [Novymonas esmeraldas]|uniref:RNA uridylyltransferase n=1 Tax=Novymonas esmeraldas TaxID=1808958 RepID=A0AAW0EWP7_9TRYP